jgi:hypothetical protein
MAALNAVPSTNGILWSGLARDWSGAVSSEAGGSQEAFSGAAVGALEGSI